MGSVADKDAADAGGRVEDVDGDVLLDDVLGDGRVVGEVAWVLARSGGGVGGRGEGEEGRKGTAVSRV